MGKEPWRAINVDQGSVDVQECAGYVQRKMTLRASGERVTERVTINEEMGEIRYNKCDSYGTPGDVERVLAIHTPLRDPVGAGMKVDSVRVQDMSGYMQRSMRLLEKPGSPTVTDNIRVMEGAREILYRPVKNGQES